MAWKCTKKSMQKQKTVQRTLRNAKNYMENIQNSMQFNAIQWNSMKFNAIQWNSMKFNAIVRKMSSSSSRETDRRVEPDYSRLVLGRKMLFFSKPIHFNQSIQDELVCILCVMVNSWVNDHTSWIHHTERSFRKTDFWGGTASMLDNHRMVSILGRLWFRRIVQHLSFFTVLRLLF